MSMSAYSLSETVALLVTGEVAAYFMLHFDQKDGTVPEEVRQALSDGRFAEMARSGSGLPEEYYDSAEAGNRIEETGIGYRCHGQFEGLAATLDGENGKCPYPRTWSFDGDCILYIPAKRETSPFRVAYPENWLWCRKEQIGGFETLAKYAHLGEPKKIERASFRHMICGAEWDEYYSGDCFIGHGFDGSRIGTMYSEAQARRILTEAIKSNFPDARVLSVMKTYVPYGWNGPYRKEERVRIERAWERIAAHDGRGPKNLRRSFIEAEAAKEREHSRFFGSYDEIRKLYPDCVRSYG